MASITTRGCPSGSTGGKRSIEADARSSYFSRSSAGLRKLMRRSYGADRRSSSRSSAGSSHSPTNVNRLPGRSERTRRAASNASTIPLRRRRLLRNSTWCGSRGTSVPGGSGVPLATTTIRSAGTMPANTQVSDSPITATESMRPRVHRIQRRRSGFEPSKKVRKSLPRRCAATSQPRKNAAQTKSESRKKAGVLCERGK